LPNGIENQPFRMHSRAEYYRRRGIAAKERAAQSTDLSVREAFKDVARHWLALAERVDWLDRQQRTGSSDHKKPVGIHDIQKYKEPGRVPTPREKVPRSRALGFSGKRTGRVPGQGENL
jgi:hypothetical protein